MGMMANVQIELCRMNFGILGEFLAELVSALANYLI